MKDDDVVNSLERSIELRVRNVSPQPNVDDFLARVERRGSRQRRWLVGAVAAVLAVGGLAGFVIGRASDDPDTHVVLAPSSDFPRADTNLGSLEPPDAEAARAAIVQAFRDGYDGITPESVRSAAIQYGERLGAVRANSRKIAELHGYTAEQLAGTTIEVLDVSFIDRSHAAVRFTITIPGHGDVLVDRVGYAVVDGGRWKVSLRTACDLLSLGGLLQECPPN